MITAQSLHDGFDQQWDIWQSDYHDATQKDLFINRAQIQLFNDLYNPSPLAQKAPGRNAYYESSLPLAHDISPFNEYKTGTLLTGGILTFAEVAPGAGSLVALHSLGLKTPSDTTYTPASWGRKDEIQKRSTFSLLAPDACDPMFHVDSIGLRIQPSSMVDYEVMLVRTPIDVSLSNGINSEFLPNMRERLVLMAVLLAAQQARDREMESSIINQLKGVAA